MRKTRNQFNSWLNKFKICKNVFNVQNAHIHCEISLKKFLDCLWVQIDIMLNKNYFVEHSGICLSYGIPEQLCIFSKVKARKCKQIKSLSLFSCSRNHSKWNEWNEVIQPHVKNFSRFPKFISLNLCFIELYSISYLVELDYFSLLSFSTIFICAMNNKSRANLKVILVIVLLY